MSSRVTLLGALLFCGASLSASCAGEGPVEPDVSPAPEPETGPCDCGTFSLVGSMASERYSHTALALSNGTILLGGGNDESGAVLSTEIFDPATGASVAQGQLPESPRFGLTLHEVEPDLRVLGLFAGSEAALYTVEGGLWTSVASARLGHTRSASVLLDNGDVLLIGGASFPFVDRFALATETWVEESNLLYGRESHTATLLEDGRVLVVGGYDSTAFINQGATEIFDPVASSSEDSGTLEIPRQMHKAIRLRDGRVLIAGGFGPAIAAATAVTEVFNPTTNRWTRVGDLPAPRIGHTLTLLADGRVLMTGGIDPSLNGAFSDAAVFIPELDQWRQVVSALTRPRHSHAAARVGDDVFLFGGNENVLSDVAIVNAEIERYAP